MLSTYVIANMGFNSGVARLRLSDEDRGHFGLDIARSKELYAVSRCNSGTMLNILYEGRIQ